MADKAFELPRSLIRKHGTNDPFRIAKELNIPVHFRSMKRQKAFCLCVMRNYSIHINENLSEQMQRMACAHELGHIMLHKDLLRPEKGEKARQLVELELFDITSMTEYEANLFAANLLIDEDRVLDGLRDGSDIVTIASTLNVNVNLLAIKLVEMKKTGLPVEVPFTPSRRFLGKIEDRADAL